MFTVQEISALGNALNVTFGKSSDTLKVTHSFQGDRLDLKISQIVHFSSEQSLRDQVRNLADISNDIFTDALKKVKGDFKESAGRALKVKELTRDDDVELISATSNSPRKIAYYRSFLKLEIS
jgi:hypothetical protein